MAPTYSTIPTTNDTDEESLLVNASKDTKPRLRLGAAAVVLAFALGATGAASRTFCRRGWTGDSEHSEGYYNRQWNYVVNGRGDYNGDPLAEDACANAYRN